MAKVADRDTVHYRRLTDRPAAGPEGSPPAEQEPPTEQQLLPLAGGNWQHLPTFARPGATAGKAPAGDGEETGDSPGEGEV